MKAKAIGIGLVSRLLFVSRLLEPSKIRNSDVSHVCPSSRYPCIKKVFLTLFLDETVQVSHQAQAAWID